MSTLYHAQNPISTHSIHDSRFTIYFKILKKIFLFVMVFKITTFTGDENI